MHSIANSFLIVHENAHYAASHALTSTHSNHRCRPVSFRTSCCCCLLLHSNSLRAREPLCPQYLSSVPPSRNPAEKACNCIEMRTVRINRGHCNRALAVPTVTVKWEMQ